MGSFWRTGLESCALRPCRDTDTNTELKTFTEGGSTIDANHQRLESTFCADEKARGPLPSKAIKRNRIPRYTGKSGTP